MTVAAKLHDVYRRAADAHNKSVIDNRFTLNIIVNCLRFWRQFELTLRGNPESASSSNPGLSNSSILIQYEKILKIVIQSPLEKQICVSLS